MCSKLQGPYVRRRRHTECVLYSVGRDNKLIEVDRTEVVKDSLYPQWVKKFEMDFRFEERQARKYFQKIKLIIKMLKALFHHPSLTEVTD